MNSFPSDRDDDMTFLEKGREIVRRYDAGDRTPDVVAYVECEGVVEQREIWNGLSQDERDAEEASFHEWRRGA